LAGIYLLGKEDCHVPGKEESLMAGSYLRNKEGSSLSTGNYIPTLQGLLHGKRPPLLKQNTFENPSFKFIISKANQFPLNIMVN
jgi:hypothetical protein